jgi:hypothetical protein
MTSEQHQELHLFVASLSDWVIPDDEERDARISGASDEELADFVNRLESERLNIENLIQSGEVDLRSGDSGDLVVLLEALVEARMELDRRHEA